jgi:hypothetical protein
MSTIHSRGLTTQYRSHVVTKHNNLIQLELHVSRGLWWSRPRRNHHASSVPTLRSTRTDLQHRVRDLRDLARQRRRYSTRTYTRTHAPFLNCHLVRLRAVTAHAATRVQIEPSVGTGAPVLPEDSVADLLVTLSDSSSVSTRAHPHT